MTLVRLHAGLRALALICFILLEMTGPAQAQSQWSGRPIHAIEVEGGDWLLVPEDRDRAIASLRLGDPLSLRNVSTAIERLYLTGRFADIAVDAREQNEGVAIRFIIEPAAFIRNVVVLGAEDPPTSSQLANATKLQLGERFEQNALRQSTEGLLERLRANGFYLAKVVPEVTPHEKQQVDITFRIETGDRARFTTPTIRGTPQKPVEEVVESTRWQKFFSFMGWKEVTETRTAQGLERARRAYQKRDYLMARLTLEQMEHRPADNVAVPSIRVESGPKVVVRTRGAKISRGRLRELLPIYQELTVDRDLLVEGKRELTEFLQSKGYFDAQVDFDMTSQGPDETIVEYSLFPGDRHKLVMIDISGNTYFNDATLRERMYVAPASLLRFRRGRFSQDYLRRDVNALRALYDSNGFRDVQVRTRVEDDYAGKENEVAVFFEVTEGAQWRVGALEIAGVDATTADDLRSMLQSTEGQPYSDLNVATDRDTILTYFFTNGFPDATLDVTATQAEEANRMNLKYTISTGRRQTVRDVLISGLRTTDPEIVKQRIILEPGDPLSLTSLVEGQRRLYDLGIFARVDAAVQNQGGESDNKYVLYRFEEASKISVTGGFGAQIARIGRGTPSFDTPAGTAGFSPRVSFGISRSNFLGVGHTLSLQGRLSNIQRRGLLTYLAPQFKGNDELSLTFTGIYDDLRDVQTFNSRRQEGSIQLSHRLTKANTSQYRLSFKRVTVTDLKITPELIPLFSQPVQLATVSTTFIQDRRDDAVDARRGIYNTLDLALASNFWGEPRTAFVRALGRNATYHRLGRELVFARSTSVGVMVRLSGDDVPLPERFFAGGANSHRGFPDNQTGPRDLLTGFPIGGKALLLNNHELRFPLIGDNIGGVLFHDAGNVYSEVGALTFRSSQRDLTDFNYMVHAVGLGVRYRTPIGPVRVDLAYSMNSPRFMGLQGSFEELLIPNNPNVRFVDQRINQFQFHFSLGQLF